jgi:hypothetical protein
MPGLLTITGKESPAALARAPGRRHRLVGLDAMTYQISSAARKPADIVAPSTGSCPAHWCAWWREQSEIDGTTWDALLRQHGCVFRQLCQSRGVSS